MDAWIAAAAEEIAARAERELEALVGVSSPSGDVRGAEEVLAIVRALLPDEAAVERLECSSPGHAPDLLATVTGTGTGRAVLVGHVDTVIAHADHRPLEAAGDRLTGSGTIDMKGGDVLAVGVLRAFARVPERFAELALLLVCDEEWRTAPFAHRERFAGYDACLCFEGGQTAPDGADEVVVRRKAAGTLVVDAHGRSAHSGSSPDKGANALLALAEAAQIVAGRHDPTGAQHLTAVPTVLSSGDAFNVVPGAGRLICDLRADAEQPFEDVLGAIPAEVGGVRLEPSMLRVWPGMDAREAAAPVLAAAAEVLGRPIGAGARGGASDASHLAKAIAVTIDGLGPLGGDAHHPDEFVLRSSFLARAELALALVAASFGRQET
ncbi:MAG: family metallopeptidase [Solirubrobacterales bacterium]|nr:family metallopeptidase [Solirubrobacterales bacterium]